MKVEPAGSTVVHESTHALLARVAVTRHLPRRPDQELEGAFLVERVADRGRRDSAMDVKIVIAHRALVSRSYADLLATIAFEWKFRVLESELVLWVAEVEYLAVFHDRVSENWLRRRSA